MDTSDIENRHTGCSVRLVSPCNMVLPSVLTAEVTNVTRNTAICGGNVTDDGGIMVTERGVCWSMSQNPTVNDSHTIDGCGTGTFTSSITGLIPGATYYVRAYATNTVGTTYGEQKAFTTQSGPPTGAIDGLFSISATHQVYFSQGNLQYQASSNTWRFATNQYDIIGEDNDNISPTYEGWIDLFGWGTSGYNHGAICYQPWSTSWNNSDYYAYGIPEYDLYEQADWGYNAISNGGNIENQWRTLWYYEWEYVFNTRNTSSGIRYAKAQVNGVNGVILVPDNWSGSHYSLSNPNNAGASYNSNLITSTVWTNNLQAFGAVFLPAADFRYGLFFNGGLDWGFYWSASHYDGSRARYVFFSNSSLEDAGIDRCRGLSVRLVCNAE